MIVQRLWADDKYDDKFYDDFIARIKKNSGSCDEVWMCTLGAMPELSTHAAYAEKLKGYAEKLRAAGITVSLQVARTIGHGAKGDAANYAGEPAGANFTVDLSGQEENGFYCARNEGFREYFAEVCRIYCEKLHPSSVYFDDDLRLRSWAGKLRCACPACLKAFNEKFGAEYTAETLGKAVEENAEIREKFLDFTYDNIAEFAERISRACVEGYKDVIVGLQHGSYSGELYQKVFAAMKKSGAKAFGSRCGAGAYTDDEPFRIVEKVNDLECQFSRLPDFVTHRCPEIEGYPHLYYDKSAHGFLMESVLNLAQGFNFLSFAAFCANYETELFDDFNEKFAENRAYLDKLAAANVGTRRIGVCNFIPKNYYLTDYDYPNGALTPSMYMCPSFYYGLPVTYERKGNNAYYLPAELVSALTEEEIDMLLKSPVVLSGQAVMELEKRGLKDKIGVGAKPIKGGYYEENIPDYGSCNCTYYCGECTALSGGVKALSYYAPHSEMNMVKEPFKGGEIAACIAKTVYGAQWLAIGYAPERRMPSLAKARMVLDAVAEISDAMPVKICGCNRLLQYPRGNERGVTAVTLLNASMERTKSFEVKIENPAGGSFEWLAMDQKPVVPEVSRNGNFVSVKLPELAGWSAGTLFIK